MEQTLLIIGTAMSLLTLYYQWLCGEDIAAQIEDVEKLLRVLEERQARR
jgi:hypothetical protein